MDNEASNHDGYLKLLCRLIGNRPDATLYILSQKSVEDIPGLKEALDSLLDELGSRNRAILSLRFGLFGDGEKSLEEVGLPFGLTRERVRQIERLCINTLRYPDRFSTVKDILKQSNPQLYGNKSSE